MKIGATSSPPAEPQGQADAQHKAFSLLPDDLLVSTFRWLDEPARLNAARACRRFASLIPQARRGAPLPTRLELLDLGCSNPDGTKILQAFKPTHDGISPRPQALHTHYVQTAAIQAAIRRGVAATFFVKGQRYTGGAKDGVPQNFGWHDYSNARYEGEFEDGKPYGRGVVIWADGDRYEGEFKDNKRCGRGTCISASGARYDGEWRDGKEHGRGTETCASGAHYKGEWQDGEPHGRGTYLGASGTCYDGEWRHGKQHGRGVYTWPNGDRYAGEFRDGWRHNEGLFIGADGARYEGSWKNGQRHGQGVLTRADGSRFAGQFADDEPLGEQPIRRRTIKSRLLGRFSGA